MDKRGQIVAVWQSFMQVFAVCNFDFCFNTRFDVAGSRCLWSRCVVCLCCFAAPFKGHVELICGELWLLSLTLCCVSWTLGPSNMCNQRICLKEFIWFGPASPVPNVSGLQKLPSLGPRGLSLHAACNLPAVWKTSAGRRWPPAG